MTPVGTRYIASVTKFYSVYDHGRHVWRPYSREEKRMEQTMTRLELLTLLLSIRALLESDNVEKAKELIAEVIVEAKKDGHPYV